MNTLSLQDFHDKVKALAAKYGEDYATVSADLDYKKAVTLKAYINKIELVTGLTVEECINKLVAIKEPPVSPYKEIVI